MYQVINFMCYNLRGAKVSGYRLSLNGLRLPTYALIFAL